MNEEYDQMMMLEEMESLREILEEMGCTTRSEVEAQFAAKNEASICDVLDWMDQVGVSNVSELSDKIVALHTQLDAQEYSN